MYYGIFLGVSDNTHKQTARKCILTKDFIKSKERLHELLLDLQISQQETIDILKTKYWDMKTHNIKDFVINV